MERRRGMKEAYFLSDLNVRYRTLRDRQGEQVRTLYRQLARKSVSTGAARASPSLPAQPFAEPRAGRSKASLSESESRFRLSMISS